MATTPVTTSTTTFNPTLNEIFEEAFERCGLELRSGYDFKTARRSLNFLLGEWANRGINMWTIDQGTITLVQGTNTYDLPSDTVDLLEHVIRTNAGSTSNQADLTISRISISTYASIPNKITQARPIQILVNRLNGQTTDATGATAANPSVTVWPTPDGSTTYTLVYWRLRRLYDAGDGANVPDIPFRFQNCLVAGLAYMLSMKLKDVDPNRVGALKSQYDEAWQLASEEDREKAPVRFVPRQSFL